MARFLFNLIAFQIGWFACVWAGARGLPWVGTGIALAIVALHLYGLPRPRAELVLILLVGVLGLLLDSAPVAFGLIDYASGTFYQGLAPNWIVAMWLLFATLLNVSLYWLRGRLVLGALLGALGAPLAYYAGARLGGADFAEPVWQGLALLALNWALAMPLMLVMARRFDGTVVGTGR